MMSSTRLSLRPSAPPGWNRAKSSAWKFRILLSTSASASPTASIAVVLVLGARPSEQTSSRSPSSITTFAARPTVLVLRRGDRDERHAELAERRQQLHDFGRLAALREHHDDVVRVDAAQVAVKRLGRVQEMGPRAGRRERGGDLLADEAGLAHAGDDHAALAGEQQLARPRRTIRPRRSESSQSAFGFEAHDLAPARSCSFAV